MKVNFHILGQVVDVDELSFQAPLLQLEVHEAVVLVHLLLELEVRQLL